MCGKLRVCVFKLRIMDRISILPHDNFIPRLNPGGSMIVCRIGACLLASGLLALNADAALAQEYPNKPIRVVTSGLGGGTDLLARLMSQGISGALQQPVIVDNRSGGVIGEIVAR